MRIFLMFGSIGRGVIFLADVVVKRPEVFIKRQRVFTILEGIDDDIFRRKSVTHTDLSTRNDRQRGCLLSQNLPNLIQLMVELI